MAENDLGTSLRAYVQRVTSAILQKPASTVLEALGSEKANDEIARFMAGSSALSISHSQIDGSFDISSALEVDTKNDFRLVFIKNTSTLSGEVPMASQVRYMTSNKSDPIEMMHFLLQHSFLPMINVPDKGNQEKAQKDVIKGVKQLYATLRQAHQDAEVPDVTLSVDSSIDAVVAEDDALIEKLSKQVKEWGIEISRLIRFADSEAARDTASAEITFWEHLQAALEGVKTQVESPGVYTTFEILTARRAVIVDTFKSINYLQTLKKVKNINSIMKDVPIAALLKAASFESIEEQMDKVFLVVGKIKMNDFSISRLIDFMEAVGRDVQGQASKLLQNLFRCDFLDFDRLFQELDLHPIVKQKREKHELAIFGRWTDRCNVFLNMIQEVEKQRGTKKRYAEESQHIAELPLKARLEALYTFRRSHHQLTAALGLVGDTGAFDTKPSIQQLQDAFLKVAHAELLNLSPDGSKTWEHWRKFYDQEANRSEKMISSTLRDRLGAAKTASEMFHIFSKFRPLLKRPRIRGAVLEFQNELYVQITQDVAQLGERLKLNFAESEAGRMGRIRDFPTHAGTRMWYKQIQRQLERLQERLSFVLGENWREQPQGKKLAAKFEKHFKTLKGLCGSELGDHENEKSKKRLDYGQIFVDWEQRVAEDYMRRDLRDSTRKNKTRTGGGGGDGGNGGGDAGGGVAGGGAVLSVVGDASLLSGAGGEMLEPRSSDTVCQIKAPKFELGEFLLLSTVTAEGDLTLTVTFDRKLHDVCKEWRSFEFQKMKVGDTFRTLMTSMSECRPHALILLDAVRLYQRIVNNKQVQKNEILLRQLLKSCQQTILKLKDTTWNMVIDPEKDIFKDKVGSAPRNIRELYSRVMELDEKALELSQKTQQISTCIIALQECPLNPENFKREFATLQKIVDDVTEGQFSDTAEWVQRLNQQLHEILRDRLQNTLFRWTAKLTSIKEMSKDVDFNRVNSKGYMTARAPLPSARGDTLPGDIRASGRYSVILAQGMEVETEEEDELLNIPTVTLAVRMRDSRIVLDPPLEYAQATWIGHLQSVCQTFCGLPHLVARYDAGKLIGGDYASKTTFHTLVQEIGVTAMDPAFAVIKSTLAQTSEYLQNWLNYQSLWDIREETILEFINNDVSRLNEVVVGVRASRQRFKGQRAQETYGAVHINYKEVQADVKRQTEKWHETLQLLLADLLQKDTSALTEIIKEAYTDLDTLSFDRGNREALKLFMSLRNAQKNRDLWEKRISSLWDGKVVLERGHYKFPSDWIDNQEVKTIFAGILGLMEKRNTMVTEGLKDLQDSIVEEDKRNDRAITVFVEEWQEKKPITSPNATVALQELADFEKRLQQLESEQARMMDAKKALGLTAVHKDRLLAVRTELENLRGVWTDLRKITDSLVEFTSQRWQEVEPRQLRATLQGAYDELKALPASFHEYKAWQDLSNEIHDRLQANRLLVELKSDAMKPKHWAQIKSVLQVEWDLAYLTVGDLWESNMYSKEHEIREIVKIAQGESALEQFLIQIKETWQEYSAELTHYQNKCWLIRGWDQMFEHLLRDISALEDMAKSQFYNAFKSDAQMWEDKLNRARDAFDVWLDVQRRWVYLDGIFYGSEEIKVQLPKEFKNFSTIETEFVALMNKVHKKPQIVNIVAIENLQTNLEGLLSRLQMVQKALGEFLEKQRQEFSRFYFIGDEDLLEIIGSAKTPRSVQKHMSKLFAGINELDFDADFNTIEGMRSKEGELVKFVSPIRDIRKETMIGRLSKVEEQMRATLASLLESSMAEILVILGSPGNVDAAKFLKWIALFPAQSILLSIQVIFSQSIDEALGSREVSPRLKQVREDIDSRLNLLSDTVLRPLESTMRKKIEQLLTEMVHQKDVVRILLEKKVTKKEDFDWVYQMRFYWDPNQSNPEDKLNIKVANASFFYGFEYLGLAEKLVQTPLTDNIYLTLTQALHAKLGGCPFGPAGTGKTETVKMLGAQLGRFVLTFNCDENFDFNSMGRIFLGICQVGAWGCFDEFNRLEERMLSAVSGQILGIQTGLKNHEKSIDLLGRNVKLNTNTGIFVTMNPGYAGRSNLPDNLKQLFRNMACTKPDEDTIASVLLYTRGFRTANLLSSKITLLFKLCLDQLSAQPHYDFGLRALKSVLSSAGELKRKLIEQRRSKGKAELSDTENAGFEIEVLIQSIFDTVMPKLVADDVPLLKSLIRDVFPGVSYTPYIEEELQKAVFEIAEMEHLEYRVGEENSKWLDKVWQLYQIQKLHHGLMLVGPSGTGKSTAIRVLMRALEKVTKRKHELYSIDPKAISKDELYGVLDSTTMEWTDGVFTSILRNILNNVRGEVDKTHWIVFDGDVDPEWVENLNSVLDDNKLLTLPNGERLAIPPNIRMMFEVENLKYATLATVSRCGMIWFSEDVLTAESIFKNYLDKFAAEAIPDTPEEFVESIQKLQATLVLQIRDHFAKDGFVLKMLEYTNTLSHVMEPSLMRSLNSMWALFIHGIRHISKYNLEHLDFPLAPDIAQQYMLKRLVFATVFGFGGDLELEGRYKVADHIYEVLPPGDISLPPDAAPDSSVDLVGKVSLIDFEVSVENGTWSQWVNRVVSTSIDPSKITDSDVVIQTIDTLRNSEIAQSWLANQMPMLFCGPPGSGKTMTLTSTLSEATNIELVGINFSAGTTPELIQQIFSQYCETKKSPSGLVMRPRSLDQQLVVFCDEINLPKNDSYGTQRVITYIRQLVAQQGFWRSSDSQWVRIERVQFVGACNPPTDPGRVVLSNRFLRYAPVLLVDYPSEISMKQIYGTFVRALLQLHPHLSPHADALTAAMVEVYLTSQKSFTPDMQSHYIYSPRELSRYVRAMYEAMVQTDRMTLEDLVRLYTHEGLRLFYDRLVEDENRKMCADLFDSMARKYFGKCDLSVALKKPILYTKWITKTYSTVGVDELREYMRFRLKLFYEEELNVKLVAFDSLLHHALRIDRVLKQPMGHALLIGISGSGKSTLARFVAWMNGMAVYRIKVTNSYTFENFEEDLRVVMKRAGCGDEQICFVFDEMAALGPAMIERMNALLASGEVPGLFEGDEYASLIHECKDAATRDGVMLETSEELFKRFTKTVQRNLHIVFTMNPAGTDLANRATTSPALFNRCVVNWMGSWSSQALTQVGVEFTAEQDLELLDIKSAPDISIPGMEQAKDGAHCATVLGMTEIHECVKTFSEYLGATQGRYNYITPRSFLEYIHQFNRLIDEKKEDLRQKQRHLTKGVDKLVQTQSSVEELQITLAEQQKVLEAQNTKAEEKLKEILKDQNEAKTTQANVQEIAQQVETRNAEVEMEKLKVNEELKEVEPMIEEAKKAVTSIRKQNLDEVRSLPNPPQLVRQAMEMVVLMLGETNIAWDEIRKVMRREDFIFSIINYDPYKLASKVRDRIKKEYFSDGTFSFETVNKASKACGPLVLWGQAQLEYTRILDTVRPLTEKIESLEVEKKELEEKKMNLDRSYAELEATVETLKKEYASLIGEAEKIKSNMIRTQDKVERSVKMLKSLESEAKRWAAQKETYSSSHHTLGGDCILSAAFLSYGGYFDQAERGTLLAKWKDILTQQSIKCSPDVAMKRFLTNPEQKHMWVSQGLRDDEVCVENAAIIARHHRYPLIIDPSGQSVEFLMNTQPNLVKASFLDASFVKSLESAVRFGGSLLVQDVENFDTILNPILNQEVTKAGGRMLVSVGQNEIDYNPAFQLFLITRDPNPQFGPDLCSRVNFANFTVTPSSLESQCLNKILKSQRPDVEKRRADLVKAREELAYRLAVLEVQLLDALSAAEGNLLEDEHLMSTLETTKTEAAEVMEQTANNDRIMGEVNTTLEVFKPLAGSSRQMFFLLEQLPQIHFLYRFSMNAFMEVFDKTLLENASDGKGAYSQSLLASLSTALFKDLYDYICLSLKKEDHIVFAVQLAEVRLMDTSDKLSDRLLSFLLKGSATVNPETVAEDVKSAAHEVSTTAATALDLDVLQRRELEAALSLREMSIMRASLGSSMDMWQTIMASPEPEEGLPVLSPKGDIAHKFAAAIAMKILRPDRLTSALRDFVNTVFACQFVSSGSSVGLRAVVADMRCDCPLVLAAAAGYDSSSQVEDLAGDQRVAIQSLAMGTSQAAAAADRMIPTASRAGSWVLLKNVHLDPGYLAVLSKSLGRLRPHVNFRLFLTSEISPKIPPTLLHQTRLLMLEAPGGVKANLMRTLAQMNPARVERGPPERVRLHFLLAWLHAVIQERVQYAPIGWTQKYEFGESDRKGTVDMVDEWFDKAASGKAHLNPDKIPWQAITTLIAQSTYGGRVGNQFDKMLLESFLARFLHTGAFDLKFKLVDLPDEDSLLKRLTLPQSHSFRDYEAFVRNLPENESPLWVGLPPLSERMLRARTGEAALVKLLNTRVGDERPEEGEEEIRAESPDASTKATWFVKLEDSILGWDKSVSVKLPTPNESAEAAANPMFRCFNRELKALISLQKLVKHDLATLQDIGNGVIKANAQHRTLIHNLERETVPTEYLRYHTVEMPVTDWVQDLSTRMSSLASVMGTPDFRKESGIWLGGLLTPEAFITATRQAVAQAHQVSLQELQLRLEIGVTKPAEDSFTVKGLMIEGAKFQDHTFSLSDEVTSALPPSRITWVKSQMTKTSSSVVDVPVYLNANRTQLSFSAKIELSSEIARVVWYQRGLAIVLWSRQAEI